MPTTTPLQMIFYVIFGILCVCTVEIVIHPYGPFGLTVSLVKSFQGWKRRKKEQQQEEEKQQDEPILTALTDSICPNCSQNVMFLEGPCGGMSQNIKCPDCGQKYNWCPGFFAEKI